MERLELSRPHGHMLLRHGWLPLHHIRIAVLFGTVLFFFQSTKPETLFGVSPGSDPNDFNPSASSPIWTCSSILGVIGWARAESNHRHGDLQSPALPTELLAHILNVPPITIRLGFFMLYVSVHIYSSIIHCTCPMDNQLSVTIQNSLFVAGTLYFNELNSISILPSPYPHQSIICHYFQCAICHI